MKPRASAKRTTRSATATVATKRVVRPTTVGGKYGTIRRELQKQRQAILNETGEVLTKREGPEAFPDVSDQASAEVDQNFSMRIKEREQKLLKKIDEALDRLKKNTYGICERCEEEIPYQRLKARPVTTLCIACKTLQEQEEKIRR
jgi:RNA polymerase-binding transcription factor